MKIATWNVNSIAARLPHVLRWLEDAKPDVLCVQEIKCVAEKYPLQALAEAGYTSAVFGQPTYNGVAILSKTEPADVVMGLPGDDADLQARLIAATVSGVRVVNVYIPNGSEVGSDKYAYKLKWIARLRAFLDSHASTGADVLLCGDFNVAPEPIDVHDPGQWEGKVLFSIPEREAIENVRAWGFTDAFRLHVKDGGHYSWWDYRAGAFRRNAGLRIDHVWVTASLAARCTGAWIDKGTRTWDRPSDHAPVIAEFS